MKKLISACKGAYSAIIFLFLYLPIVVLIVLSFNESSSRAVWGGFSLKWYTALLENSSIRDALVNTLFNAAASAALATVVGTAAAIGINSMRRLPQTQWCGEVPKQGIYNGFAEGFYGVTFDGPAGASRQAVRRDGENGLERK